MLASSTPEQTVRAFVDRINDRDVAGIGALLTEDHRFIDALGKLHQGAALMRPAWESYFDLFPDYSIAVEHSVVQGEQVALFGTARAAHAPSGDSWEVPAAWLAVTREGRVAEWRVYCDNGFGPLRDILARAADSED